MKIRFSFLLLLAFIVNVHSQDATTSVSKNQFKVNVLFPGFVYEHGFTEKNTLYSEVSLGFGYRKSSYYYESTWSFYPMINEQFRHYYNLEKRADKGKRTAYNSGNFLALNATYNFKPISTNNNFGEYAPSFTLAPVWGLQRTYNGKLNLELHLGAGINVDKYNTEFAPVANFTLGWVIGK
ncbi:MULTISPECIES: hypothetical protein [Flavobacterium]|uniref:DUF3575 domain-containing protein n=1 Tax=Flavobacterium panici TaxID=2654843 RepID=A0A9N8J4R9_9FLAO|nr:MULTISPECIES: hypothetical protein [Flavobacterium]KOP39630.1 hypothetical protein AKO67_03495 [Flavobacterium sp. VMW]OWU90182.1 hypothetical protein APR43_13975 [Flavobacterium sp. NLM]UUF16456.1 hypothetical protein NLJ00_10105 [Flavobacterium panici]CAC9976190.1 hypothetical protein FLAPXU55_03914 [Flavobacterium panici]